MPSVDILAVISLPPFLRERLDRDYLLHELTKAKDRAALLAELAPRVRAVVPGGSAGVVDAALMDALPKLEIVSVFGVGYDGVDIEGARKRGITVTNTPDVLTEDVADVALGLMLNVARRFVHAHNFVMAGKWATSAFPLASKLGGRQAGILGLGRIGKAIAKRAEAFGMQISYHGRRRQDGVPYRFYDSLAEMAAAVDYLIVACQGGAETRNLVDARVLAALGKKGVLINIARGSIVDEPALADALAKGTIKAAGLDVFVDEPHVPEAFLKLDNVVLLPHTGSATVETRTAMANLCCDNLDAHFAGKPVLTRVV